MSKINLYVVYEDRDLAKRDGAFFNPDLKTWQCEENNERCIKKYKRVYFNAGYDAPYKFWNRHNEMWVELI